MSIVKLNNRGVKDATAVGSITGLGNLVFISRATASSSSSLSITSGIDSTYKEYIFFFNNMHPATDDQKFTFNLSIDGGSNYNVTKTTTAFRAYHTEDDSATSLSYRTGDDLAQSTDFEQLGADTGNDNDQCHNGEMYLFNPSSTTFVKHFLSVGNSNHADDYMQNHYHSGYCNVTAAIDAVQFKFSSGNIDAGTVKMYGIKES